MKLSVPLAALCLMLTSVVAADAQQTGRPGSTTRMPDECVYPPLAANETRVKPKGGGVTSRSVGSFEANAEKGRVRLFDSTREAGFSKRLQNEFRLSDGNVSEFFNQGNRILVLQYCSDQGTKLRIVDAVEEASTDGSQQLIIKYSLLPDESPHSADELKVSYAHTVLPSSQYNVTVKEVSPPYFVLKTNQRKSLQMRKRQLQTAEQRVPFLAVRQVSDCGVATSITRVVLGEQEWNKTVAELGVASHIGPNRWNADKAYAALFAGTQPTAGISVQVVDVVSIDQHQKVYYRIVSDNPDPRCEVNRTTTPCVIIELPDSGNDIQFVKMAE